MKEKPSFKDFILPLVELILLVLSYIFFKDLIDCINSGTMEALASIVLIPVTLGLLALSVVFDIVGLIVALKNNKHKYIKWFQFLMLIGNVYMLVTTLIELF